MAGILVVDTLPVTTDTGECQIQLCVGDITALPKEDKVDVLVTSAFPGDYSPTPSSLIGQLQQKLMLSVKKLAKDKEEDLRQLYSCWWSKPLPDHFSFGKILCFEGRFDPRKKLGEVVGDVFRCLVPVLGNKEGKVIMPLLASGDQRFSKKLMLKLLVNAAVHWIKAGLPLRCLKIVLFSRNITKKSSDNELLIKLFQNLKENHAVKVEEHRSTVSVETYDIYLSYSEEDKNYLVEVIHGLKKNKSDLRIFSTIQELDAEESWQEKLYDTITNCRRVMALISPSYLRSPRCTEQYNIALCHSRKENQNILVPLYVTEVPYMPTYMRLTQYIDCRINSAEKISVACITVVSWLLSTPLKSSGQDESEKVSSAQGNYDVFLSYCHRNEDKAKQVMKELRIQQPNINIFLDTAELKAGGAWQQTLYEALDCSKFVIALISGDYLRSKVCVEEFSLSMVLQQQHNSKLLPLIIEPLIESIEWLSLLSPLKSFQETPEKESTVIADVCKQIVRELKEPQNKPSFAEEKEMMSLASVLEETRSLLFQDENHFTSLVVADVDCAGYALPSSAITPKNLSTNEDVYIISSEEDSQYCQLLRRLILSENPSLIIKSSSEENNSARLSYLDQARLIIPLLSSSFMKSPELVHELNIAWCRQRNNSSLCFLAITLDQLPDKPTYAHIFPSFFNCEDDQWTKTPAQLKEMPSTELANLLTSCTCPQNIVYCFFTAAHFLHEWMAGRECLLIGLHDKFANFFHLRRCIQRSKETSLKLNDAESHQSDNKDEILVIATNSDPKCDALETSSKILENTSEGELKLGVENNCALDEDVVESIETAPNKVTACNHVDKDETKRTGDEIKLRFEKNKPEKSSTSSTTCLIF